MNAFPLAIITAGCLSVAGATGCDEITTMAPDASGADSESNAELTPWDPNATTTAIPTYSKGCRFGADTIVKVPSNGQADDLLVLTAATGAGSLELRVNDGGQTSLTANVALDRGLADKSWRNASGTATWSGKDGTVVDGAICFADKLAAGSATKGELTLVMRDSAGAFYSVSGGFALATSDVRPSPDVAVSAPNVDINLQ